MERLDRTREQLGYKMRRRLAKLQERHLKLDRSLSSFNPKEQVIFAKRRLGSTIRQLQQAMQTARNQKRQGLVAAMRQLDALSPLKVMQRGYSLVYDENQQQLIKSVQQVQIGDILKLRLSDGRVDCHVWSMEEKQNGKTGNDA
jgi:exodeoxyribonuclease VII large subunit